MFRCQILNYDITFYARVNANIPIRENSNTGLAIDIAENPPTNLRARIDFVGEQRR